MQNHILIHRGNQMRLADEVGRGVLATAEPIETLPK
jgi:hypothetical protein